MPTPFVSALAAMAKSKTGRFAGTMGARGAGMAVGGGVGLGVNPLLGGAIAAWSSKLDFRGQGRKSGFAGPKPDPKSKVVVPADAKREIKSGDDFESSILQIDKTVIANLHVSIANNYGIRRIQDMLKGQSQARAKESRMESGGVPPPIIVNNIMGGKKDDGGFPWWMPFLLGTLLGAIADPIVGVPRTHRKGGKSFAERNQKLLTDLKTSLAERLTKIEKSIRQSRIITEGKVADLSKKIVGVEERLRTEFQRSRTSWQDRLIEDRGRPSRTVVRSSAPAIENLRTKLLTEIELIRNSIYRSRTPSLGSATILQELETIRRSVQPKTLAPPGQTTTELTLKEVRALKAQVQVLGEAVTGEKLPQTYQPKRIRQKLPTTSLFNLLGDRIATFFDTRMGIPPENVSITEFIERANVAAEGDRGRWGRQGSAGRIGMGSSLALSIADIPGKVAAFITGRENIKTGQRISAARLKLLFGGSGGVSMSGVQVPQLEGSKVTTPTTTRPFAGEGADIKWEPRLGQTGAYTRPAPTQAGGRRVIMSTAEVRSAVETGIVIKEGPAKTTTTTSKSTNVIDLDTFRRSKGPATPETKALEGKVQEAKVQRSITQLQTQVQENVKIKVGPIQHSFNPFGMIKAGVKGMITLMQSGMDTTRMPPGKQKLLLFGMLGWLIGAYLWKVIKFNWGMYGEGPAAVAQYELEKTQLWQMAISAGVIWFFMDFVIGLGIGILTKVIPAMMTLLVPPVGWMMGLALNFAITGYVLKKFEPEIERLFHGLGLLSDDQMEMLEQGRIFRADIAAKIAARESVQRETKKGLGGFSASKTISQGQFGFPSITTAGRQGDQTDFLARGRARRAARRAQIRHMSAGVSMGATYPTSSPVTSISTSGAAESGYADFIPGSKSAAGLAPVNKQSLKSIRMNLEKGFYSGVGEYGLTLGEIKAAIAGGVLGGPRAAPNKTFNAASQDAIYNWLQSKGKRSQTSVGPQKALVIPSMNEVELAQLRQAIATLAALSVSSAATAGNGGTQVTNQNVAVVEGSTSSSSFSNVQLDPLAFREMEKNFAYGVG